MATQENIVPTHQDVSVAAKNIQLPSVSKPRTCRPNVLSVWVIIQQTTRTVKYIKISNNFVSLLQIKIVTIQIEFLLKMLIMLMLKIPIVKPPNSPLPTRSNPKDPTIHTHRLPHPIIHPKYQVIL